MNVVASFPMTRSVKYAIGAIICVFAMACGLLLVSDMFVTRPSLRDKTVSTMFLLHRRILIYSAEHGFPPKSLEELPRLEGYKNELIDGWSRKIGYRLVGDNVVELTSVAKDGLPVGAGENHDIVRRFALHDEHGNWNDPLSEWSNEKN